MNSIPKVIHYCWFGHKPLPELAKKCIASWREFFPDYQIKEWNEDNFDVKQIPFTEEAYSVKKYAFVSDYARFKILYDEGGVYFDTDVEVIKSFEGIIQKGPFMGLEIDIDNKENDITNSVNPGLGMAASPGNPFYKKMLDLYQTLHFEKNKKDYALSTIVTKLTSEMLLQDGWIPKEGEISLVNSIFIYPKKYFCPYSVKTRSNEITNETYSIHHYASSWLTRKQKWINNHKYVSLFFWLLQRPLKENLKGLKRVVKERKIW